ncbi:MAG TPA: MBL fold metallo-hydrolase [candidate division Zixibacteria bacterium]|nr:MBL fold metallo-hydrolase [candidate division Zixibacteria bacterium]
MSCWWRIAKVIGSTLLILCALLAGAFVYCFKLAPRAGAAPDGERLARIRQSPNYHDEKFHNTTETTLSGGGHLGAAFADWLFGADRAPANPLPVLWNDPGEMFAADSTLRVTWFGHSTTLLTCDGAAILLDPMFSSSAAPFPYLGNRFPITREITGAELPQLDAVVISHDHYDHLDLESVRQLAGKTRVFLAPLGVGAHLERWGVAPDKIIELDWWESTTVGAIEFIATPARHFSGRGAPASNGTLCCSWVVRSPGSRVFFSGDSGYFDGFKEIGRRYGPFDLALLECGQYSENWPDVHMAPEETAQALLDVRGAALMPIHWGAFDLSLHAWNEPPRRLSAAAAARGIPLALPRIGETFSLHNLPQERWWERVP